MVGDGEDDEEEDDEDEDEDDEDDDEDDEDDEDPKLDITSANSLRQVAVRILRHFADIFLSSAWMAVIYTCMYRSICNHCLS